MKCKLQKCRYSNRKENPIDRFNNRLETIQKIHEFKDRSVSDCILERWNDQREIKKRERLVSEKMSHFLSNTCIWSTGEMCRGISVWGECVNFLKTNQRQDTKISLHFIKVPINCKVGTLQEKVPKIKDKAKN
jgi:hypothetical protein